MSEAGFHIRNVEISFEKKKSLEKEDSRLCPILMGFYFTKSRLAWCSEWGIGLSEGAFARKYHFCSSKKWT